MDFKKFAYNSVTRNFKSYLGYYFSCTVSVMLFFIFAMAIFHPSVSTMGIEANSTMGMALSITEVIIAAFSLLFILYSLGTFVKSRYREFGTFMILGMSDKQFKRFILLENLIIGIISILSGIIVGFIFAKPFLNLISKLFGTASGSLYFPTTPIILTFIVFIILFLITSPITIVVVKNKDIIELLNGSKKPKAEPKASLILGLLSIILLIGGYISVLLEIENIEYISFVALILGAYIFFTQFTVLLFKKIKNNRKFYQHKTNVLWISNLVYKIKDNARLLFLTSVLLSVTLVSISALSSFTTNQLQQSKAGYPFPVFYMSEANNKIENSQMDMIEKTLSENNYKFEKTDYEFLSLGNRRYVISNSEYNKIGKVLGYTPVNVSENDAIAVPIASTVNYLKDLDLVTTFKAGNKDLKVVGISTGPLLAQGFYNEMAVVNDNVYNELAQNKANSIWIGHGYNYADWENSSNVVDKIEKVRRDNAIKTFGEDNAFTYEFFANLPNIYQVELQSSRTLLFIGTFIGIIFFVGSCSFLYFRFYTDLIFDKEKYKNLSKLGLSYNEMKKTLNIEIGSIFFIPFIIATLNGIFGLVMLNRITGTPIGIRGLLVIVTFFIIYYVYFVALKSKYIKSIAKEIPGYLE